MSGPELKAIKTAATDLKETAGIYLRNPDYVASAEAEQKASSSGKVNTLARRGNRLNHPDCSCLPERGGTAVSRGWLVLRGHGTTEGWGQPGPPCPHTATRAGRAGLQPGATTDANHCGAGTGLGGECPGGVIVPEITVAVCKSKEVVFHPGPASGSTHWAYTEISHGAD